MMGVESFVIYHHMELDNSEGGRCNLGCDANGESGVRFLLRGVRVDCLGYPVDLSAVTCVTLSGQGWFS